MIQSLFHFVLLKRKKGHDRFTNVSHTNLEDALLVPPYSVLPDLLPREENTVVLGAVLVDIPALRVNVVMIQNLASAARMDRTCACALMYLLSYP